MNGPKEMIYAIHLPQVASIIIAVKLKETMLKQCDL